MAAIDENAKPARCIAPSLLYRRNTDFEQASVSSQLDKDRGDTQQILIGRGSVAESGFSDLCQGATFIRAGP
jgi:hypothetical protein